MSSCRCASAPPSPARAARVRPSYVLVVVVSLVLAHASDPGDGRPDDARRAPACEPPAPPVRDDARAPADTDAHGRVVLVCVAGEPCREVGR